MKKNSNKDFYNAIDKIKGNKPKKNKIEKRQVYPVDSFAVIFLRRDSGKEMKGMNENNGFARIKRDDFKRMI